jgi:ribonuclease HII
MTEDPFDFIKIMMLLFLASIVAMATPDANASTCRNSAVKHQFDKEQGYPQNSTKTRQVFNCK